MQNGFRQTQRAELKLKVDPRLVLRSQMLQYTRQELEQAVETELADNPALERLEDDSEPITEEALLRVIAPQELGPSSEDAEFRRSLPNDDPDRPDWVEMTAADITLSEHLAGQLLPMLSEDQRRLGAFLIASLDDNGYLTMSVEEVALETHHSLEEVEAVLALLQQCEPWGVGASSVQECLILQLREADTVERKLARAILRHNMEDFLQRRVGRLMRKYKVLPEVIEAAFQEILSLNPFPGDGFCDANTSLVCRRSVAVTPDLRLERSELGWSVEIAGVDPTSLAISRSYRRRLEQLKASPRADRDERQHVGAYVNRAQQFIDSLKERKRTLRLIGQFLVQHQESFITTGRYEFLQPLTRTQMARELGLHESTVSRATMGKFVQIGNGEVVPFEVFFKPALRIQKMIEEILESENPQDPYSDEEIAAILAKKGVEVARRTVNKYRDRTKLLSSRARRSA